MPIPTPQESNSKVAVSSTTVQSLRITDEPSKPIRQRLARGSDEGFSSGAAAVTPKH
jgi:hypothetical protein